MVLALTCAACVVPVTAAAADAVTDLRDWRFVRSFPTLTGCQVAGQSLIAHRYAADYRCEHDYTKAGVPELDLYVR
jgi:hypothetical protein